MTTEIEFLSTSHQVKFAEDWYAIADDSHFWVWWRFDIFEHDIASLGVDPRSPLVGLDIGCGHGAVQRQLAAHTGWTIDGCDLNRAALALNAGHSGRVFYYDINDRRPELHERYDFIVLFDVIEHIEDTRQFLESALHHLRPGGYAFINVPAIQGLFSKYDTMAGHLRRYDKRMLRTDLAHAGLDVLSVRYWGMSMIPLLFARKLWVGRMSGSEDIIRVGFRPPGAWASALLSAAAAVETGLLRSPPLGTSLLASARKPR